MRMNGNYLLDSNIIIDIFRGDKKAVSRVKRIDVVYVPVIAIGELYYTPHPTIFVILERNLLLCIYPGF